MEAYQFIIRKEKEINETLDFNINSVDLKKTIIKRINKSTATKIILEYEWLHSMPFSNKYFFGLYFIINDVEYLGGVLVFGNEYSENTGVWKKYGYENKIILLSRGVCLWWTPKNSASFFISRVCKWFKDNTNYKVITATVDKAAGEVGTIYQSLNWNYVGLMSGNYHGNKMATRFGVIIDGKLRFSRWVRNKIGSMKREEVLKHYPNAIFVPQYRKERYFHFIGNKRENKIYFNSIKHLILPYKKRNYDVSGTIYSITNKINNKIYIGQTIRSFQDRIREYEKGFGNEYINNAFNKYGWDNFEFKIIDVASSIDELNTKEIKYINDLKSNQKEFGYNIESGGRNSTPSIETLEKMSKSHLGIVQTEAWINKRIAQSGSDDAKKYGKLKTNEEKIKLTLNSLKYWQGKNRDNETKLKISKTKKELGFSNKQKEIICKKVYKININTNKVIQIFDSTAHASKIENVNQSTISRWCSVDKLINEYIWSYKLPNELDLLKIKQIYDEKFNSTLIMNKPKNFTLETHQKLSNTKISEKQSQKHINKRLEFVSKPVLKIDRKTNKIIERFISLADAGKTNNDNLSYQSLLRLCLGMSKQLDDIIWCYESDFQNNIISKHQKKCVLKELNELTIKLFNIAYNEHIKNNISIRKLSDIYSINFSTLNNFINNKNKPTSIEFNKSKNYQLVCKKTNKIFVDYLNKSGVLTTHISELYPEIKLESKFKRKQIEIKTGKPWYFNYFNFIEIN